MLKGQLPGACRAGPSQRKFLANVQYINTMPTALSINVRISTLASKSYGGRKKTFEVVRGERTARMRTLALDSAAKGSSHDRSSLGWLGRAFDYRATVAKDRQYELLVRQAEQECISRHRAHRP